MAKRKMVVLARESMRKSALYAMVVALSVSCASSAGGVWRPFDITAREIRISVGELERVIDLTDGNVRTTSLRMNGEELLAHPAAEFSVTATRAEPNARPRGLNAGEGGSIDSNV